MKSAKRQAGCWIGVAAAALVVAAGCQRSTPPERQAKAEAAPLAVTVVKPARGTVRRVVEQPGQAEAYQQTPVYVKIAGYVKAVHKDISDPVKKGELLAELWVPEMEEELRQKAALVEQAKAEVELAKKAFEAAKAAYETAKSQVEVEKAGILRAEAMVQYRQSEYGRLEKLKSGTIDPQAIAEAAYQLDAARAARKEASAKADAAEAARDESAAKRDKAESDVRAAEARHKVAEADRRRVAALLEYARVTAPFDGRVTQRNVDEGHFLQPAASGGGKGEPLFVVVQGDPVRVFVNVPETDAAWVNKDDAARVRVQALRGKEFLGNVTRISWALDYTGGKAARTLRTEIDLPNPKGELRPGMYVLAAITVERAGVLTLPTSAVVTQGEQSHCFRVVDGKAVRTPVQVGLSGGGLVEVVKKRPNKDADWVDFTGDEQIVEKAAGIADGQAVQLN